MQQLDMNDKVSNRKAGKSTSAKPEKEIKQARAKSSLKNDMSSLHSEPSEQKLPSRKARPAKAGAKTVKPLKQLATPKLRSKKPTAAENQLQTEVYESKLPEFENKLDLLSYFGIEVFDPNAIESNSESEIDQTASELLDFDPNADMPVTAESNAEPDPLEELALLLATAEEAESVRTNFAMLHSLREEDIALKEVPVIRLNDLSFGQVTDAVAHLTDEAHALVEGKSQVFFHDRSSGKIFGQEVYAFVYDHATVESVDSRVIAAGRAAVYADGGWIGAKDESIVYVKGDAIVQATGDAIIVAEGKSLIEASGTVAVLVSGPAVRVRLLSQDACVIMMNPEVPPPEIETPDHSPPKFHQLVGIESPLGLEKMMELSFRESQRRERLSWDYS